MLATFDTFCRIALGMADTTETANLPGSAERLEPSGRWPLDLRDVKVAA